MNVFLNHSLRPPGTWLFCMQKVVEASTGGIDGGFEVVHGVPLGDWLWYR